MKVTRQDPARVLPALLESTGTFDGENVTWPTGPLDPGVDGSAFELNTEGGQSVIFPHGSMGSTETFDPTDGNVHTGTLTADCTITLNAPSGTGAALLELWLTQDGTGGWDVTWPGSVTVNGTPDTTLGTTTVWLLDTVDGGTSWVAFVAGGGSTVAALDDLTDVTITSPAEGDMLRYDGSVWVNTPGRWEVLMDGGSPPEPLEDGSGTDWLYIWVSA